MNEQHTVYVTLRIGDKEFEDVPLEVLATYCPHIPASRDGLDFEEPERFEVWRIKLGDLRPTLEKAMQDALGDYLLNDMDAGREDAMAARRQAVDDLFTRLGFPTLEVKA